ncbi:12-oxophytodienoate reductase [Arthrobacter sulfonylureivorans]|uniref:12-oxophytodienoate reductase n=2 Tax=Arthrobacter sulfonylureivorans TaxID=2486855 RepID=A0ABY3WDQ4_9MICC|nr:12-oxophytodienoate reductase [Arthrobacter sulfonylureivorans]
MTRNRAVNGIPSEEMVEYYERRAEHGIGLIITEGTYIDTPDAGGVEGVPVLRQGAAADAWSRVVEKVHSKNAAIFAQLWHIGAALEATSAISPSGIALDGRLHGRHMTMRDMDRVCSAFAEAAVLAQSIGFDGVEIHGAHGYLIDQFLWDVTNHRLDEYGGTHPERARFAADVVSSVRREVGPDFPISFRFSQFKVDRYTARIAETPDQLAALLRPIAAAGTTIFHASARRFWEPAFDISKRTLAGWAKDLTGMPVIAVGSLGLDGAFRGSDTAGHAPLQPLVDQFMDDQFDLVASGRSLLVNPNWVDAFSKGELHKLRTYRKEYEAEYF